VLQFPEIGQRTIKNAAIERLQQDDQMRKRLETVPLGEFRQAGSAGGPEPARARPGEVHALATSAPRPAPTPTTASTRLVREGLRFKQLPGGQLMRSLPRSLLHGRLPGRLDPPQAVARDQSSKDWCIGCGKCAENCPYGQHQHAPLPDRPQDGGPRARRPHDAGRADEGDDLRPVHRGGRPTELRLRVPARPPTA